MPGGSVGYDDGRVQLDRQALTLRRYHFPSGTAKIIPLSSIRGYRVRSLGLLGLLSPTLLAQRFSLWGGVDPRSWLPLDAYRPLRSTLIILDVGRSHTRPAFTPEDPQRFTAVLDELLRGDRDG